MGFALARVAAQWGAEVTLVSGPTSLQVPHESITLIRVTSAKEMYQASHRYFDACDVAILSAAVADYRPKVKATQKIKKSEREFSIQLEKTEDILATLGAIKQKQYLVGFALETENELENAKTKLKKRI